MSDIETTTIDTSLTLDTSTTVGTSFSTASTDLSSSTWTVTQTFQPNKTMIDDGTFTTTTVTTSLISGTTSNSSDIFTIYNATSTGTSSATSCWTTSSIPFGLNSTTLSTASRSKPNVTWAVGPPPRMSARSSTSSTTTTVTVMDPHADSTTTTSEVTSTSTTSLTFIPSCVPGLEENVGVLNGDLEDGLAPWSFDVAEPRTAKYGTVNDGVGGSCSSFLVSLKRSRETEDRPGFQFFSPLYDVEIQQRYLVSFYVKFREANEARIMLSANSQDRNIATAVAFRDGTEWTRIQTIYVPTMDWIELLFAFDLDGADSNTFLIDRIQLTPAPPLSSTAASGSDVVAATFSASPPPASTDFTLSVLDSTPSGFTATATTVTTAASASDAL
ncbi:hypothetical protein PFICI_13796 [Pestalotiopsis fici W106-1]|uniref:Uncharacterized protein n=1 Tax=Pestalotiopsis fici (strain W106-1 / CGMCC3.15140) TaxID=1229662 RepID=W3WJ23_PESFW|nr:uncharacterized protein PFICI_13796 [Pestalotiopsis fici W106-1]ETS73930.1 hypothetical protein PFICI_13796 [Pestalotiopsis fici W106-1]